MEFKKQNKEIKRDKPKNTLKYREQTDGYQRGGGWEDGWNRWKGLRVHLSWWPLSMNRIAEPLYCMPETSITLHVNYTGIKTKKKEKEKGNKTKQTNKNKETLLKAV